MGAKKSWKLKSVDSGVIADTILSAFKSQIEW